MDKRALSQETLNLLWDSNGYRKKEDVINLLIKNVFEKIENENLKITVDELKYDIRNLPKSEQELFNFAFEKFESEKEKA